MSGRLFFQPISRESFDLCVGCVFNLGADVHLLLVWAFESTADADALAVHISIFRLTFAGGQRCHHASDPNVDVDHGFTELGRGF